jgi:hypothetical protein
MCGVVEIEVGASTMFMRVMCQVVRNTLVGLAGQTPARLSSTPLIVLS